MNRHTCSSLACQWPAVPGSGSASNNANAGVFTATGMTGNTTSVGWPASVAPKARAAVMIAAADHGLPVYEYSPKKIKMAVVGKGTADKAQVAFMVRALLGLAETPSSDAADALAIGLAHLQASDPIRAKLLDRRLI